MTGGASSVASAQPGGPGGPGSRAVLVHPLDQVSLAQKALPSRCPPPNRWRLFGSVGSHGAEYDAHWVQVWVQIEHLMLQDFPTEPAEHLFSKRSALSVSPHRGIAPSPSRAHARVSAHGVAGALASTASSAHSDGEHLA